MIFQEAISPKSTPKKQRKTRRNPGKTDASQPTLMPVTKPILFDRHRISSTHRRKNNNKKHRKHWLYRGKGVFRKPTPCLQQKSFFRKNNGTVNKKRPYKHQNQSSKTRRKNVPGEGKRTFELPSPTVPETPPKAPFDRQGRGFRVLFGVAK